MDATVTVRSEAKENQIKLFQSHQYLKKISQLIKRPMLEQMEGFLWMKKKGCDGSLNRLRALFWKTKEMLEILVNQIFQNLPEI